MHCTLWISLHTRLQLWLRQYFELKQPSLSLIYLKHTYISSMYGYLSAIFVYLTILGCVCWSFAPIMLPKLPVWQTAWIIPFKFVCIHSCDMKLNFCCGRLCFVSKMQRGLYDFWSSWHHKLHHYNVKYVLQFHLKHSFMYIFMYVYI